MESFDFFVFARALHVIGIVLWIGGVAFVTTVLLPSLRKSIEEDQSLELFEKIEGKFAFQAKIVTFITGLTGFYMLYVLDGWERYLQPQFWWIHLMTMIWFIFTLVLFVLEPLFLHQWFHDQAIKDSKNAFLWLHRMHTVLLTLSLITVLGAVAGSHGFNF